MKRSKGFSLAEMMAVIAVLGILAVLLLPNVLNAYKDAKKGVLLDEAKSVYAQAKNKYATEKASGKVVGVLTDAESTDENTYNLELTNDGVEYFVRLDAQGEVISLVVIDGDYCVYGTGDFLDTATKDVVEPIIDPKTGEANPNCLKNNRQGLYAKFILDTDFGVNNLVSGDDEDAIYYYYGQGWYSHNDETGEYEPISQLNSTPKKNGAVFSHFEDKDGNQVIDKVGNISNSQETIARYKDTKSCDNPAAAEENYGNCVVTLTAKYRPPQANLVFDSCESTTGAEPNKELVSKVAIDLPNASNVGFKYNGHVFVGWVEGSCENARKADARVINGTYSREVFVDEVEDHPEYPTDGQDINLYAKWAPNTIEASDVICKPDEDNYCTQPVYYKFGNKRFVLYRITSEGYKAILDGYEGPYSYLQTDCCNHGNCYYTSVNYTRSQLAKKLNGDWLKGMKTERLVNSSWYSGYKNNELLNIETARVGILNYAEYLHTNGKGYNFVFTGGPNVWWWTMTPTTNQPYYYDGQYYLANVILRYNSSTKVVDYDEMTVNGTVVGTNHIYGANDKAYYRPVVVFKPKTPVGIDTRISQWGTVENPLIIQ